MFYWNISNNAKHSKEFFWSISNKGKYPKVYFENFPLLLMSQKNIFIKTSKTHFPGIGNRG